MISRRPLALRILFGLLMGVGLVLGISLLGRKHLPRSPVRLVLAAEDSPWPGFRPEQERGLLLLMADALEIGSDVPVVLASDLLGPLPDQASLVRVKGYLLENTLTVDAHLSRGGREELRWRGEGPPRELFRQLLTPLGIKGEWARPLIPTQLADLTALLETTSWESDQGLAARLASARRTVTEIPDCATAWLSLAELEHRNQVLDSNPDPQGQEKCQEHFEQALAILPAHPRATHLYAIYLTDIGNQREAFTKLEKAIRAHPSSPALRNGLTYAARTSGLLEVGLQAVERRDRLQGRSKAGRGLAENTFLYHGDLERFAQSLGPPSTGNPEPILDFYRGYYLLVKGDRAGALQAFQKTTAAQGSKVLFEALAKIYSLGLQDQTAEALVILDKLRDQRLRLRVPDGEFTFKIAEAYGFLGREADAMLVAERSFSQGFGCTQWYEATPFLASLRPTPRWHSLIQHMKERQALLTSRFPPSRFK